MDSLIVLAKLDRSLVHLEGLSMEFGLIKTQLSQQM
jgi:hypothetical protein